MVALAQGPSPEVFHLPHPTCLGTPLALPDGKKRREGKARAVHTAAFKSRNEQTYPYRHLKHL